MKRWLVVGAVLVLPVIAEAERAWVLWWRESWFTNQDMQRTSWKRFSAAPTWEDCDAMLKGAMRGVIEAGVVTKPTAGMLSTNLRGSLCATLLRGPTAHVIQSVCNAGPTPSIHVTPREEGKWPYRHQTFATCRSCETCRRAEAEGKSDLCPRRAASRSASAPRSKSECLTYRVKPPRNCHSPGEGGAGGIER